MSVTGTPKHLYYYGWNIVAVCVVAQIAALGVAANCFSLFLADWSRDLGAKVSLLTIAFTGLGVCSAVLAPVAGLAVDRLPVRWLMTAGLLGIAVFEAGVSQARQAWQVVVLFATLLPLSVAFCTAIPSQAVVSRWFVRQRGLALGFTSFGLLMAGAVLPPLVVWLEPRIGWRGIWLGASAAAALIAAPLTALAMRDRPREKDGADYITAEEAQAHAAANVTARDILTRPNFWILVVVLFVLQFLLIGWSINLAPFALSRGVSAGQVAILVSVGSIVSLLATLLMGAATDRFGPKIALLITLIAAALGFVLLYGASSFYLILGATVPLALGAGAAVPVTAAMAREFGVNAVGRALGFAAISSAFGVTAPPIIAALREATGDYHASLALLIGVGVLGALVLLRLKEPGRASATPAAAAQATVAH